MTRIVYINGRLVPEDEARISILDRGFLYGDGMYETLRLYDGVPFRLAAHLRRLEEAASVLRLPLRDSAEALENGLRRVVEANGISDGLARITVSRGAAPGMELPRAPSITTVIRVHPLPDYAVLQRTGVRAGIARTVHNKPLPLAAVKSLNCLPNILALAEVQARGMDEALLLNEAGRIAEAAMRNVFIIADAELRTPPLSEGLLPGVTRAALLEIAPTCGLRPTEVPLSEDACLNAEEMFLASSGAELLPVIELEGKPLSGRKPGPKTLELLAAYRGLVRREISLESGWRRSSEGSSRTASS